MVTASTRRTARAQAAYIRYQSPDANPSGHHLGIFALVMGLAHSGALTLEQEAYRLRSHAWFNDAYPHPPAGLFDRDLNPIAICWFKATAIHLLARIPDYVATLLDPHSIAWERISTDTPGRLLFEDDVQVVAASKDVDLRPHQR